MMRLIYKIIFAIILGLLVTLYFAQNDDYVKCRAKSFIQDFFYTELDSKVDFEVEEISFFAASVKLKNFCVDPLENNAGWDWTCKEVIMDFSWINLLLLGKIGLNLKLKYLQVNSDLENGELRVLSHLCKLFSGMVTDYPVFLRFLLINDAFFEIDKICQLSFNTESKLINNIFRSKIYFLDGDFFLGDERILDGLFGDLQIDSTDLGLIIKNYFDFNLNHLEDLRKQCTFSGSWKYNKGMFHMNNIDSSFEILPMKMSYKEGKLLLNLKAKGPASYLQKLFLKNITNLDGNCLFNLNCDLFNLQEKLQGNLSLRKVKLQKMFFDLFKISFERKNEFFTGKTFLGKENIAELFGKWSLDSKDFSGNLDLVNTCSIRVLPDNYWVVNPSDLLLNFEFDNFSSLRGNYNLKVKHEKIEKFKNSTGKINFDGKSMFAEGTVEDYNFKTTMDILPNFKIKNLDYGNKEKKLIKLIPQEEKIILDIDYLFLKDFLPDNFTGQGILNIEMLPTKNGFDGVAKLNEGNIRIGSTYNFIRNFKTDFNVDLLNKSCFIQNFIIGLLRGKMLCNQGKIYLDEDYEISFLHLPFLIDKAFFNWNKDLASDISGNLIIQKKKEEDFFVKGNIILDKAYLKKNIFSDEFRKSLFTGVGVSKDSGVKFDLVIDTKNPIQVKTSFLKTLTHLDLSLKEGMQDLEIVGLIGLEGGSLEFPYKPLHILSGSLYFLPNQLYDPIIEVVAKNQIRKYIITMRAEGSLQYPNISFESVPPLTEDQIIALLLVGSEEESLNISAPALVLQNVKGIVFGPEQPAFKLEKKFKNILKPLKHVRIVPSFSDQTGRGGFRGGIEIEVNDQLRALIQRNFSLSEDTKFEVEYQVSDDINLRAIKDERGDLGGEFEIRWKF